MGLRRIGSVDPELGIDRFEVGGIGIGPYRSRVQSSGHTRLARGERRCGIHRVHGYESAIGANQRAVAIEVNEKVAAPDRYAVFLLLKMSMNHSQFVNRGVDQGEFVVGLKNLKQGA